MKKFLVSMGLVATLFLVEKGEAKDYTIHDVMAAYESSTYKILKGFLWDKDELIIEGAHTIATFPEPKEGMLNYVRPERRTKNFEKTLKILEGIVRQNAKQIEELMKKGNKSLAAEKMTDMIKGCNSCHAVFRGW
jgi:hypothetical protein